MIDIIERCIKLLEQSFSILRVLLGVTLFLYLLALCMLLWYCVKKLYPEH